jgi:hypothetical protein
MSAEAIDFDNSPFAFTFNPDKEKMYYIYQIDKQSYVAIISEYDHFDNTSLPSPNAIKAIPSPFGNNTHDDEFNKDKPISIIYNPSDKNVYVLSLADTEPGSIVYVINSTDDSIKDRIKLTEMRYPVTLAYNPFNEYVYASGSFDPMEFINTTSGKSTALANTSRSFDITYNPENKNFYLTTGAKMNSEFDRPKSLLTEDLREKGILVLDGRTNKIIDSIPINARSYFSEYNPSDKQIYVTSSNGIFSINSTNNKITNHISNEKFGNEKLNNTKLYDIVYNNSDKLMYVSSDVGIISINTTSNEIEMIKDDMDEIEFPWSLMYNPLTELIYYNNKNIPADRFCEIRSDGHNSDDRVSCLLKW